MLQESNKGTYPIIFKNFAIKKTRIFLRVLLASGLHLFISLSATYNSLNIFVDGAPSDCVLRVISLIIWEILNLKKSEEIPRKTSIISAWLMTSRFLPVEISQSIILNNSSLPENLLLKLHAPFATALIMPCSIEKSLTILSVSPSL